MRERLQKIIEEATDPKEAALKICVALDDLLDLGDNGWFDDDDEVIAAIEAYWSEKA